MPMVVLGLLSVCQLTFLPGFLAAKLAKLDGVSDRLTTWFGLGLVANYLLVVTLTVLHAYTRPVVLALFAAEVAAALWLARDRWRRPIGDARPSWPVFGAAGRVALSAAVLGVAFVVAAYARQLDEVFRQWDAVVSWDRWAMDWSRGELPRLSHHYPQLVPANWSLTYRFIGTSDVKFFAHALMIAIEVVVPLALLTAGWRRRDPGYFVGSALAAWLLSRLGSQASGYVDTAVACLALLAVLAALEARAERDATVRARLLALGAVLAAGAAVTKQAGLWIAIAYPFMALAAARERTAPGPGTRTVLATIAAIDAVVILPWYVGKEIAIRTGRDVSEIAAVTGTVHAGRSLAERAAFGLGLLNDRLHVGVVPGLVVLALLVLALAVACREREGRWLAVLIAPFSIAWLLLLSYDARNLTLALPLLALGAGIGVRRLVQALIAKDVTTPAATKPPRSALALTPVHLLVLSAAAATVLVFRWSDARLLRESLAQQRRIGDPTLNELLYAHDAANGFAGKVLTDYQFLGSLPQLARVYELGFSNQHEFVAQSERPEIGYVLYRADWAAPEVSAHFTQLIERGQARRVLECDHWELVTTCRGPCDLASRVDPR